MTNKELYLQAAELLTKAASRLEYNVNLSKEAAATTDAMINHGMLSNDQRAQYTEYLTQNPEKIASMNSALNDLRVSGVSALGELAGNSDNLVSPDDAFTRAIMGY